MYSRLTRKEFGRNVYILIFYTIRYLLDGYIIYADNRAETTGFANVGCCTAKARTCAGSGVIISAQNTTPMCVCACV